MQRRGRGWAAALLVVAGLWACDRPGEPAAEAVAAREEEQVEPLDPQLAARLPSGITMEQVQQGRDLYAVCAVCHGFDANGTQLGPSLRDPEWTHASSGQLDEIARVITEGVAEPEEYEIPMPPMGGGDFTAEQVRALAAYVSTLSPPP